MLKKNVLKITLIFVGIMLLVIAIVTLAVSAGNGDGEENAQKAEKNVSADYSSTDKSYADPFTILVSGRDAAAGLTDVLMLVRTEPAKNRATVLQIPRDTYVEYTEDPYKKINGAASVLGGSAELCDFLSDALGIEINGHLSIDMSALPKAIDTIGGIEIELPEPLVYNDPEQKLSIDLPAGKQKLDGERALQFVRYRSGYVRGDIGRMDAHKMFLAALVRRARALDTVELARLAYSILPMLDTSVTLSQALTLLKTASNIPEENIVFVTLPGEEVIAEKSGASYYSISAPATKEILKEFFELDEAKFDKKAVFKNEKYENFSRCYDNYAPYRLYTASAICENGIIIDKYD